ncbi:MAG: type II toxin-antitoxin system PemK/MazF family toxin [Bacteroidetes bacterium]|nr:MAG: type II toxin-antitoxin system PemK/MazF family toxin [Bacteroidota bacterium]
MVEIKRLDIVLVDLNPIIGTEQGGIRPAVVLQNDKANKVSPHTIIAPFTTKIRTAILPSHVLIKAGNNGLSQDSAELSKAIKNSSGFQL